MSFAHIPHLCYSILGVHPMEQVYFEQGSQICRLHEAQHSVKGFFNLKYEKYFLSQAMKVQGSH